MNLPIELWIKKQKIMMIITLQWTERNGQNPIDASTQQQQARQVLEELPIP